MGSIISQGLVGFYRFWHGALHLPGAGAILRSASRAIPGLHNYPVAVPGVGTIPLDFRMDNAYAWTNFLLQDAHQNEGLLVVLNSYFKSNTVFWDIGANIGMVSGNLFRSFPTARYYLFEPNPDLVGRLQSLFSQQENVTITETALSDRNATARLNIIPGYTAMSSLSQQANATGGIDVKLQTGDQFLADHPESAPSLIKIDVEGHEVEVLQGCAKLIATHRPIIVFEHLFLDDAALNALTPSGYDLVYIHDTTGALSPVLDRHCSHNAVLVPGTGG
jgi:FkbM family methyltransferase